MPDRATAEPLDDDWGKFKPSIRQRFIQWRRWLWARIKALCGIRPQSRSWTLEDIKNAELAFRVRAWSRLAAATVIPLVSCVGLYLLGRRVVPSATDVDALLRSVLPAAALASGLLAAGLMNATTQSKELRRRRVDALRECQGQLKPLRHAFDALTIDFNNRIDKGEALTVFLDLVWPVGFEWSAFDESDTGKLMSVAKIDEIVEPLSRLSGMLWRPKHYRHLVAELEGRPAGEVTSLRGVVVTTWEGVRNAVGAFNPDAAVDSWRYLSFWEDLVNETLELATRMRSLSYEVHYQSVTRLRAMFAHLAWLVVVGVAVPLVTLTFTHMAVSRSGLALVAVGGMLAVLTSSLVLLYRWITQRRLHDEGRLEV